MTRDEIYDIGKKYLGMSQSEIEKNLTKFLKPSGPVHIDFARNVSQSEREAYLKKYATQMEYPTDNIRLQHILEIVQKYCDAFVDITDDKIKRKVGKLIFSGLNYRSFGNEPTKETKARLDYLFGQVVSKKINPYKVLYGSVLTDGNLNVDFDNETREYDKNRDLNVIFDNIKNTLKISDEETVKLFEKCSSLISKISADRVPKVYECLNSLYVGTSEYGVKLFDEKEVVEILKINPSLFGNSRHKMWGALRYLENKAEKQLKDKLLPLHSNEKLNFLLNKRQLLRKWLKNNSSLLNINEEKLISKERFLKTELLDAVHPSYRQSISRGVSKIFENVTNLAYINGKISYTDMRVNARKNLHLLEAYASPLILERYLQENPFVLAMNSHDLTELFAKIDAVEDETQRREHIQNFFAYGKALFANKTDFKVDEIFEKLVSKKIMIDIDIENLSDKDCLLHFAEIFMDGDQSLVFEAENLLKQKQAREKNGEKTVRKHIRYIGNQLEDLPEFLNDKLLKETTKREIVLSFAKEIKSINESRFQLADADDYAKMRQTENENSEKIENLLNKLRDVFEQKRFHVGKKYKNSDQLFETMMEYLSAEFDDKESISEIYSREVAEKFIGISKEAFQTIQNGQMGIFDDDLVVRGVNPSLVEAMKELAGEIEKPQSEKDLKHIVFERK